MHEQEQEHGSEGAPYSKNHLLIMLLCCLVPIAILIAVAYADIGSNYLPLILVFLCPVLMLLMHLPSMLPRKKKGLENHQQTDALAELRERYLSELVKVI